MGDRDAATPSLAEVTQILQAYGRGEDGAFERLIGVVYHDLRRIARRQIRRHPGRALATTELVHEAYLKMANQVGGAWEDRAHFFAIAAHAMRQILVDEARHRLAVKRGAGQHHTGLDEIQVGVERPADRILAVHQALDRLAELDERMVPVVECRYFAGFSVDETAEALGINRRTVNRIWTRARAWLKDEIGPGA